tara:strand:+ start:777 stop:1592 length:816 start_codon:yes stop_codon:yes gene_type:complete
MSEETPQVDNVEQVASEDWRSSIPEDLQNDPSLADIQDVGSLAKGYVHAQRMIGSDKVAVPGSQATQEELDTFYNKLGRPETPQGYEAPTENMPDLPVNEEMRGKFYEEAHRIGLNKQQAAALLRWEAQSAQDMIESREQDSQIALEKAQDAMRKEFGRAYEEKVNMAQNAALEFGGEELVNLLDSTGLGNEPAVIKAFANIGKAIANDEIIGGGGRQGFMMSPGEAKAQIGNLKRDPNFMQAYQDTTNAGHTEAVKEMGRLFELAHPNVD